MSMSSSRCLRCWSQANKRWGQCHLERHVPACPCIKIIILQATISNECVKLPCINPEWHEWWDLRECNLVLIMMSGTVHHCSQPCYCNAKWHTYTLTQHLTWPHESLSRNWAQPVADVHVLCERVQYIVCMSLTYILISIINSIRVPVFWNVELGGGSSNNNNNNKRNHHHCIAYYILLKSQPFAFENVKCIDYQGLKRQQYKITCEYVCEWEKVQKRMANQQLWCLYS